ncbi:hypothetical protein N7533_011935 [Penicillium manginii]|uniref:uncharacterized protein n=1 Tax=Penicillium manginii TaxID=203109 RepID=UPI0025466A66|nr:uncharacterized protein N7533_011935 [Penicillium manginii]KAJ5739151.1 hypothetical protein N7533_011935 [Penicillium manginii]
MDPFESESESEGLGFRDSDTSRDQDWYFTMHSDPNTMDKIAPTLEELESALLGVVVYKLSSQNPAKDQSVSSLEPERIGLL